jgi:hypothetical protein
MLRGFLRNRFNVLLLAGALAPLTLQADVIFSNMSATPLPGTSLEIAGNFEDRPAGAEAAEAFTPTGNFWMTDAEVSYSGSGVPYFSLFLYSDKSGEPGSMIEELGSDLGGDVDMGLVTANSFTPIDLTAGTEYWLVMAPSSPYAEASWDGGGSSVVPEASSIALGTLAWTIGSDNAEFQIDGTQITPEPSTLPLASVALLGLLIAAHRTRKRSRAPIET